MEMAAAGGAMATSSGNGRRAVQERRAAEEEFVAGTAASANGLGTPRGVPSPVHYQLNRADNCRYRGLFVGPLGPLPIVPKSRLVGSLL